MTTAPAPGAFAPPVEGRIPLLACALAWAVPGLGHIYLGWSRRGALYFVVLVVMFVTGLLLEGSLSRPGSGAYLSTLATIADLGNGLAYFLCQAAGWGAGRPAAATHEIGNAFHWSAGLMNMLLVADAWDIASGRKARTQAAA